MTVDISRYKQHSKIEWFKDTILCETNDVSISNKNNLYVTGNSFTLIGDAYDKYGTPDGFSEGSIEINGFNPTTGKWEHVYSCPDIKTPSKHNRVLMSLRVNSSPTDIPTEYSYSVSSKYYIHEIRFSNYWLFHKLYLCRGTYCTTEYSYYENYIKGKKIRGIPDEWYYATDYNNRITNPLSQNWGNLDLEKGKPIKANNPYKLIAETI